MSSKRILVVDDEIEVTSFFKYLLEDSSYEVVCSNHGTETLERISQSRFDLALLDIKLPDTDGLNLLRELKQRQPACKAIMMTGYSTVRSAVEAIQLGAVDYLEKPFTDIESLEERIRTILDSENDNRDTLKQKAEDYGMSYASSSPMNHVIELAARLAPKPINVLIEGETGTGKELLARFIHGMSRRSGGAFIGINCGAIPENLLESELFGHERGAFTGAMKARKGMFELANDGSLLLDEIGDAPHTIQVKLLRTLETAEFMRVGSERIVKSNARIISATNKNLHNEVNTGRFRSDLLYRLDGVKLIVPPLRERLEDIEPIARSFLSKRYGIELHPSAVEVLKRYHWPGNVRQLINIINQSAVIHEPKILRAEHLTGELSLTSLPSGSPKSSKNQNSFLEEAIEDFLSSVVNSFDSIEDIHFDHIRIRLKALQIELAKRIITKGLSEVGGSRTELCNKLHISPRILKYILNEK